MADEVQAPITETVTPEAPVAEATTEAAKPARRKKGRRSVPHARAYISCGFNNTIVTITDDQGNSLVQVSAGSSGFKGTKKSTPYAAQIAAENALSKAEGYGITDIEIFVKGIGPGRDQAVRGILTRPGINVVSVEDITPMAHGGCRKKKARRV